MALVKNYTTNYAQGNLLATITAGATSFTLVAGKGALFPSGRHYGVLEEISTNAYGVVTVTKKEIVLVSSRATDTFTVTRAQDGTSAQAFDINNGARFSLYTVSAQWDQLQDAVTATETRLTTVETVPTTAKTTPVDADVFTMWDSVASFVIKKVTRANIKATAKTYFDTLYLAVATLRTGLGNWKTYYTDGSGVETALTVGASNTYLGGNGVTSAPTRKAMPRIQVVKTADQTRNSTTTFANDNTLVVTMTANTTYRIQGVIFFTSNTVPDIKFTFAGPASPTAVRIQRRINRDAGTSYTDIAIDTAYGVSIPIASAGTGPGCFFFDAVIENGANAGDFAFQWAQNTSDPGNTTVKKGSYLLYQTV